MSELFTMAEVCGCNKWNCPICIKAETPYNSSSGWSGSQTSKDRADRNDNDGTTGANQRIVLEQLALSGENGLTWTELAEIVGGWHHGTASGALSVLHKAEKICRLTESRSRCRIYVLPEYVAGRDTEPHGRQKSCPNCGHSL